MLALLTARFEAVESVPSHPVPGFLPGVRGVLDQTRLDRIGALKRFAAGGCGGEP
jgi:hypothetical protein